MIVCVYIIDCVCVSVYIVNDILNISQIRV